MSVSPPVELAPDVGADGRGAPSPTSLVCRGCGWRGSTDVPARFGCPATVPGDDIDHVLVRTLDPASLTFPAGTERNPFVRYRTLFHAFHAARALGWSDAEYVALVERLDAAVAAVDGRGFHLTPLTREEDLGAALGLAREGGVFVKDETGNVSGSHKARHLMGTLLELEVAEAASAVSGGSPPAPLAIASCGNAALAAAVVARAAGRHLDVFIPPDADPGVVARLRELGAAPTICERQPGVPGDPTYARLLAAVADGAIPFTCQGNLNGLAIEGGETLGLEIVDAVMHGSPAAARPSGRPLDRLFVQVGGGALASACIQAFRDARLLGVPLELPRIHAVQTRGAFPLARAYRRLANCLLGIGLEEDGGEAVEAIPSAAEVEALRQLVSSSRGRECLRDAARNRHEFMWPWESEPRSVAHGILDDETYDWFAVVEGMLESGGYPVVVDEATLEEANRLARSTTSIDVDHTGSAGLAGLVDLVRRGHVAPDENVCVLFTGHRRAADDLAGSLASVREPGVGRAADDPAGSLGEPVARRCGAGGLDEGFASAAHAPVPRGTAHSASESNASLARPSTVEIGTTAVREHRR